MTRGARGTLVRASGFSLIEVLVAFTILALSLGVLYQVFGQGLRAAGLGEDYTRAALHASAQLARVDVDEDHARALEGEFDDGYRWRAEIAPYVPGQGEAVLTENGIEPVVVQLQVSWQDGSHERHLDVETVRLRIPQ